LKMVDLSIAMLNYQRVKLTMETKKLEVDMIQDFGVADHFYLFTSVPVRCLWLL
jgi:hypothetical protein